MKSGTFNFFSSPFFFLVISYRYATSMQSTRDLRVQEAAAEFQKFESK